MVIELVKNKKSSQWHFRIKGSNGRIVCASENYRRKSYCIRIAGKIMNTTEWKIRELAV